MTKAIFRAISHLDPVLFLAGVLILLGLGIRAVFGEAAGQSLENTLADIQAGSVYVVYGLAALITVSMIALWLLGRVSKSSFLTCAALWLAAFIYHQIVVQLLPMLSQP